MKRLFPVFTATLLLLSTALQGEEKITFTTLDGKSYESVTVTRATAEGLVVRHSNGMASIPFETLPEEIQKKYNFDPEKAAAMRTMRSQREGEKLQRLAKERERNEEKKRVLNEPSLILTFKILEVSNGYFICNRRRSIFSDDGAPDPPSKEKDIIVFGHPSPEKLAEDEWFTASVVRREPMNHYGSQLRSWKIVELHPEYDTD